MSTLNFAKGHGTRNDFVILLDPHDHTAISVEQVRWLCDRRAGIGGDGLLRAVLVHDNPDQPQWFMDYRNADGSIAEMCGNGLRVFARYLLDEGLLPPEPTTILTRAGQRRAWPLPDGRIEVTMGAVALAEQPTRITHLGGTYQASTANVGNPHAVVHLDDERTLRDLDLQQAPEFDPEVYPEGVNVEFVVARGDHDLLMRVHERGVGETWSCGTGVVAAAISQLARLGDNPSETSSQVSVTVPGGQLQVRVLDGEALLVGPAEIVARGTVTMPR